MKIWIYLNTIRVLVLCINILCFIIFMTIFLYKYRKASNTFKYIEYKYNKPFSCIVHFKQVSQTFLFSHNNKDYSIHIAVLIPRYVPNNFSQFTALIYIHIYGHFILCFSGDCGALETFEFMLWRFYKIKIKTQTHKISHHLTKQL